MPRGKKSPEVREQAIILAAGASAAAAARTVGVDRETVSRWLHETDPATIQRYVAEKRARAQRIVLDDIEAATRRLMGALQTIPLETAKDVQAASVGLGILDDHYGGRQAPGGAGRFGNTSSLLDGWTEHDRVTLERIERVTLEPPAPPGHPAPQG